MVLVRFAEGFLLEVKPLNALLNSIFRTGLKHLKTVFAEVAQHGQRRRTEAPIPQGFVGSNPTLRTLLSLSIGTWAML